MSKNKNKEEDCCAICDAMEKWEKLGQDVPASELDKAFEKQAKINKSKGIPGMHNGKIY